MKLKTRLICVLLAVLTLLTATAMAGQNAETTVALKLRNAASKDARGIDSIPRGTEIEILEYGESWCKVLFGEKEGYVQTKYLKIAEGAEPAATAEPDEAAESSQPAEEEQTQPPAEEAASVTPEASAKPAVDLNDPEVSRLPVRPEGVEDISTDPDEIIIYDFDKGYWEYTSEKKGVFVKIARYYNEATRHRWYVAEFRLEGDNKLQFLSSTPGLPGKNMSYAEKIARNAKVVLAINDDQCAYRVHNNITTGIIIRDSQIFYSKTRRNGNKSWPCLDTVAFFADGSMKTFSSADHTAEEYLEMGAQNVLAFGPWLISGGVTNPDVLNNAKGKSKEARMAIGMLEPNHFVAIMVERTTKVYGVSMQWLANAFQELGCTEAFNLDGGNTSSLVFMGKKLEYGNPTGIVRKDRALSGMIGIGYSEQVPDYEGLEQE